jgi:hypothetical protein
MYLDLDDRRLAYWSEFTDRQREGQIVRHAERDTARELAALIRRREEIAERMGARPKPRALTII